MKKVKKKKEREEALDKLLARSAKIAELIFYILGILYLMLDHKK